MKDNILYVIKQLQSPDMKHITLAIVDHQYIINHDMIKFFQTKYKLDIKHSKYKFQPYTDSRRPPENIKNEELDKAYQELITHPKITPLLTISA
jgi:hypothetical protein